MNYELIKQRMDNFFAEATSNDLINRFEKVGYSFIDAKVEYKCTPAYDKIEMRQEHCSKWRSFTNLFNQKENNKNLNKFEVFLCKLVA